MDSQNSNRERDSQSKIQNRKAKIENDIMSVKCTRAFVTLAATDFDLLVDFYFSLLGRDPKIYLGNVYAEFQLPGLRLAIFNPRASHKREFANSNGNSGMSICLEVANLETAITHLTVMGYPPQGDIKIASHEIGRAHV